MKMSLSFRLTETKTPIILSVKTCYEMWPSTSYKCFILLPSPKFLSLSDTRLAKSSWPINTSLSFKLHPFVDPEFTIQTLSLLGMPNPLRSLPCT